MISIEKRVPGMGQDQSPTPEQVTGIKPRRVDLVESVDNGQLYLRAYEGGHYYWQQVAGRDEAIPDTEAWLTGSAYHHQYWLNHGSFRRRAGCYVAIAERGSAAHAA